MFGVRSKPAGTTNVVDVESPTGRPLPHLPPELLGEIFTYAIQDDRGESWVTLDTGRGPWVLTYVNRFWRAVALRMPKLWSRFDLRLGRNPADYQFLYELLLQNSGSHPLELRIWSPLEFDSHPILDLLLRSSSNRWKTAILCLSVGLLQSMSPYASQFSLLETLNFDISYWDQTMDQLPLRVDAFALAPKLRNVYIIETGFYVEIALPWNQLTSFVGDISNNSADTYKSLWSATNLTQLWISQTYSFRDEGRHHARFPFLRKMRLMVEANCDVGSLLRCGTFPALEVLDISIIPLDRGGISYEFNMDSVVKMVKRSACPLAHLRISQDGMIKEDIIPLFELTSGLVELKIARPFPSFVTTSIAPDVIRAMTWSEKKQLLPRLLALSVEGAYDKDLFSAMVRSRINCPCAERCLHTLSIAVPRDRIAQIDRELIEHCETARLPNVSAGILLPRRLGQFVRAY